jgi:hypothetical protein
MHTLLWDASACVIHRTGDHPHGIIGASRRPRCGTPAIILSTRLASGGNMVFRLSHSHHQGCLAALPVTEEQTAYTRVDTREIH